MSTHALFAKMSPNKVVLWCPDGAFLATLRLGEEKKKERRKKKIKITEQKYNVRAYCIRRPWQTTGQKYAVFHRATMMTVLGIASETLDYGSVTRVPSCRHRIAKANAVSRVYWPTPSAAIDRHLAGERSSNRVFWNQRPPLLFVLSYQLSQIYRPLVAVLKCCASVQQWHLKRPALGECHRRSLKVNENGAILLVIIYHHMSLPVSGLQ